MNETGVPDGDAACEGITYCEQACQKVTVQR